VHRPLRRRLAGQHRGLRRLRSPPGPPRGSGDDVAVHERDRTRTGACTATASASPRTAPAPSRRAWTRTCSPRSSPPPRRAYEHLTMYTERFSELVGMCARSTCPTPRTPRPGSSRSAQAHGVHARRRRPQAPAGRAGAALRDAGGEPRAGREAPHGPEHAEGPRLRARPSTGYSQRWKPWPDFRPSSPRATLSRSNCGGAKRSPSSSARCSAIARRTSRPTMSVSLSGPIGHR
jgi:hypothetical protein